MLNFFRASLLFSLNLYFSFNKIITSIKKFINHEAAWKNKFDNDILRHVINVKNW